MNNNKQKRKKDGEISSSHKILSKQRHDSEIIYKKKKIFSADHNQLCTIGNEWEKESKKKYS